MNYFIKEFQLSEGVKFTAGIKARDDIEDLLLKKKFKTIQIEVNKESRTGGILKKLKYHFDIMNEWERKCEKLSPNDVLLIQFPIINHSIFIEKLIKKLQKRGVIIKILVHDLEIFRVVLNETSSIRKKIRIKYEETSILKLSDIIIVHNEFMKNKLIEFGYDGKKQKCLEIFDYLIPNYVEPNDETVNLELPIIIAGALRKHKAGYVYDLPNNVEFNLYGVGYENQNLENIHYYGVFPPDDLPFSLKGSFGLVWDGLSSDTCSGIYGEYLKINNPHKTSLYLSAGIPVIVWKKAAIAKFILDNDCGIVVESLNEIKDFLANMSKERYGAILCNARKVGAKLREGHYTFKALELK